MTEKFRDVPDAELIGVGDSDSAVAFGVLYERHIDDVLRYFLRRTGCAQTAADLAAETFASALQSRRRFRNTGAPGRAWLFSIARRQLSRFIRRQRVDDRARRRLAMEPITLGPEDLERVEGLVDFKVLAPLVRERLAGLPLGQLEAIRLRVVHELPYSEVAERLGCSEGAARVRVSRGLASLADELDGVG